ncbi:Hypothetical protein NCS54_00931300 [Fusarium falciforme]|uniref:Hypothetical protein n=1 Tax=Fusarium falciforme TaxID=195108 RepID=UPI0023006197|nr:Hypothetical protein NCS54_00931300 [Fusarium falciforme]WAO91830.1 Hypothetical protein NCS54_00931300 [Fusarium falciforme]
MKRHSTHGQSPNAKAVQNKRSRTSQTLRAEQASFHDGRSAQHEAEDYRLATAKMPLDALSCVWRKGTNRHLNRRHVEKLCNAFQQEAVRRMMSHLGQPGHHSQCNQVLSFEDWLLVNPNEKAEVMAGQHRIEAMREYVKQTGTDSKELWWTCIIYDRDQIPAEINVKLRVNRRDLSLPDSHGQIWMQLVLANDQCDSLFQGKKYDVEKQVMNILRLSTADKFPTARLVTLWRNHRWRPMITRWCRTQLGRMTFNISTWDWMASYRVDSYWFTTFEQVLESLAELPEECADSLKASDWAKLAKALPIGHTEMHVQQLFYPVQTMNESSATRHHGFFLELGDEAYSRTYQRIVDRPRLVFPNVQKLLKTTKEEGRIMAQVLTHVVAWLNPNPTVIIDKRQNNKPLIREDLKPVIRERQLTSLFRDGNSSSGVNAGTMGKEDQSTQLETLSVQLEKAVLDAVRDQMASFKSVATKDSLSIFPNDDKDGYQKRFANKPWKKVLDTVEEIIGPVFASSILPTTFQTTGDATNHDQPISKITREICARVLEISEVARNPALQYPEAYQELSASIDQAVLQWTLRWSRHQQADGHDRLESHEIPKVIEKAQASYESQQPLNACFSPNLDRNDQDQIDAAATQGSRFPHNSKSNTPLENGQIRSNKKTKAYSQVSWPSFQSLFSRNEGYLS